MDNSCPKCVAEFAKTGTMCRCISCHGHDDNRLEGEGWGVEFDEKFPLNKMTIGEGETLEEVWFYTGNIKAFIARAVADAKREQWLKDRQAFQGYEDEVREIGGFKLTYHPLDATNPDL